MTKKQKTNNLERDFLIKESKKVYPALKVWMETGGGQNKKYFGYLSKNEMSVILILILVLVIVGDVLLLLNFS